MGTNVSTNEAISFCAPSISTWTRGTNKHKPMYLRQFAGHKRAQTHISDSASHMASGHKRAQTHHSEVASWAQTGRNPYV